MCCKIRWSGSWFRQLEPVFFGRYFFSGFYLNFVALYRLSFDKIIGIGSGNQGVWSPSGGVSVGKSTHVNKVWVMGNVRETIKGEAGGNEVWEKSSRSNPKGGLKPAANVSRRYPLPLFSSSTSHPQCPPPLFTQSVLPFHFYILYFSSLFIAI